VSGRPRATPALRVEELAEAMLAARPGLSSAGRELVRAIYRRLALGRPIPETTLAAETRQSSAWVHETLRYWPGVFRDDQQHIIGFWGLTVADMPPHRYTVGDVTLSTWCAWDTLFITPILDRTCSVESVDASTGEPVALTVTPTAVMSTSTPGVVVSFLDPAGKFDTDVIERFCHYVHFFDRPENGERWCAKHPGTFLLDLADAFTLARRYAAPLLD
jgi:alkylmercury lyase